VILRGDQTVGTLAMRLHAAGRSQDELRRLMDAHRLAMGLFTGAYRGNGKSFVCHLVGTASLVAQVGGDMEQILAGLMHAAYEYAMYPDGGRGMRPGHEARVTRVIGPDAAALVKQYQNLSWKLPNILAWSERTGFEPELGRLLLLRIENEFDGLMDAGLAFAPKHELATLVERSAACARIARMLGQPDMAETIEATARENMEADWVRALHDGSRGGSIRVIPGVRAYLRSRRRYDASVFDG